MLTGAEGYGSVRCSRFVGTPISLASAILCETLRPHKALPHRGRDLHLRTGLASFGPSLAMITFQSSLLRKLALRAYVEVAEQVFGIAINGMRRDTEMLRDLATGHTSSNGRRQYQHGGYLPTPGFPLFYRTRIAHRTYRKA
jgi:hypothetical protein